MEEIIVGDKKFKVFDVILLNSPAMFGLQNKIGVITGIWRSSCHVDGHSIRNCIRIASELTEFTLFDNEIDAEVIGRMPMERLKDYQKPFFKTVKNDSEEA